MADDQNINIKIKAIDELTPVMMKAIASMEASASKLASSVDKINPSLNNVKGNTGGLNTGVINLAAGLTALKTIGEAVYGAFQMLSGQLGEAIGEALEAEKAANKLTGALVSQGLYTEKTTKAINDYVTATEAQTGVSGEAIQEMIAMSVQMGLSVEKAQEMEKASRMLAAATGTDVMTAFNQMQGALNGQTKGLAKVIPGVKELTAAQLKSGDATKLVTTQLEAQYKLYQGSFGNSLEKAKNALSNVYESVGKIIIQNPLVVKGLNLFADWMGKLQTAV
jgi:phage-related minor tail protein